MIRSLLITSIVALITVPAASVHAQAPTENVLRPGARVRYLIPRASGPFTGLVEQVDTATIVVRPDGYDGAIHLGLDSLRSLAVSGGLRSVEDATARGAVGGFKLGVILGVLLTTAVWLSPADEHCDDCYFSATAAAAVASALGTLALGLLGGLLGAVSPGEVWYDIPLRRGRR